MVNIMQKLNELSNFIQLNKLKKLFNELLQKKELLSLLLVVMFLLWLLAITSMKITEFPPDSFYYLKMLPIYYWIGLVLGFFLLYLRVFHPLKNNKSTYDSFLIILFVLYFFGTTVFVYSNPQFLDTYGVINRISLTVDNAHIVGQGGYDVSYPLQIAFFSQSSIISSNIFYFAKIFPLINVLLISFFIYLIARKINEKYCLIAPILYLSISWIDFQHISPQSYGLMLTSIFLFFLMENFSKRNNISKAFLLLTIIALIQMAHPITPFINIFPLLVIWMVTLLFSYFKWGFIKKDKISDILLVQLVVYFAYSIYIAQGSLDTLLTNLYTSLTDFLYGGSLSGQDYTVTQPILSYTLTYQLRKISLILIVIMGMSSIIYIIKNNKKDRVGIILAAIFFGYISIFVFMFVSGDVTFIDRGFVFSLLILPLLIVKALSIGTKTKLYKVLSSLVIIFFAFSVISFPITYQGSAPYVVPSDSEVAAKNFITQNPVLKSSINYEDAGSPLVYNKYWYNYLSLKDRLGDEYIESFNSQDLNKIYDSGQSMIFTPGTPEIIKEMQNGPWKYTGYRGAS